MKHITKQQRRLRRHIRTRSRITGTAVRPRVSVFRSLRGMYVQLIDDTTSKSLASVHSKKDVDKKVDKKLDTKEFKGKVAVAYAIGKKLAQKAQAAGITAVVFDRSGYAYHGRVAALAQGMREGGLQF